MSSIKAALQAANLFSSRTPDPQSSQSESRTPEPTTDPAILYQRFSILSLLLTLITTINRGHPTLSGLDVVQKNEVDQSDQHGYTRPHIMEAVLAVLVKDSEVVACMTYGPTGIVAIQQHLTEEDEEYRFYEGSGLRVAAITNGLLLRGGDKLGKATKNMPQGKKWGGFKDKIQGKKLGGGAKDQLLEQEAKEGTYRDLQEYALVEPGQSLWALAPIEEPVTVGVTTDSK